MTSSESRSRSIRGGAASRKPARTRSRLYRLRWVPVPLALLATMLGLLAVGTLQGQAAANRPNLGYQAAGLALQVNTMGWMSNDMTGQGPTQQQPKGFSMPANMMPGMQTNGNDRLRVEVDIRNVASSAEQYSMNDFSVAAPGGKRWNVIPDERSNQVTSGMLAPGFNATIDMYFDIPAGQIKHLTLIWSRHGSQVSVPVQTSGGPGVMHM